MIEIQYLGEINEVSMKLEMASRCSIMRALDQARRQNEIPRISPFQQNSFFKMDKGGIKVISDDGKQDVLLRLSLQQVSNIAYIFEDQQHIIAIKYGEVEARGGGVEVEEELLCRLVLLLCHNQISAEKLCSMADGFFDEAYKQHKQQANQQPQFEKNDSQKESGTYSFLSSSCSDLNKDEYNTIQLEPHEDNTDDEGGANGTHGFSVSNNENSMIKEYMDKLYSVLSEEELVKFAGFVQAWHADMSFDTFLHHVAALYRPEHMYLIKEMRAFIPPKDLDTYEQFMQQNPS